MGLLENVVGFFKSDEFKSLPEKEREYRGCLALAAYAIDGRLDAREKADFESFRSGLPAGMDPGLEALQSGALNFAAIQRKHLALDWSKERKKELAQWIRGRVVADGELASEESAFLVQMGQILHGGERVPLFLGAADGQRNAGHDFFEYLTEARFREDFPNSRCHFTTGTLYTYHPFLNGALVPFSEEGLQVAQMQTLRGVMALVQELGARRVTIRHGKNFSAAVGYSTSASAVVSGATLSEAFSLKAEALQNTSESLECAFEGRMPLYARWVPWFWKRRMLQRYAGCDKYIEIIEARLSPNQEKVRVHKVTSDRSAKFSASLALSIKTKDVDAGESLEAGASAGLALNEELRIEY